MFIKIKDIPEQERPRERMIRVGKENLSNEELLSIIIKTGTKGFSVKEIANSVLNEINSINNLENITINAFKNIKGLGKVKTIEIMAAIELGKRIFLEKDNKDIIIYNNPKTIYQNNLYLFKRKKQPCFISGSRNPSINYISIIFFNNNAIKRNT